MNPLLGASFYDAINRLCIGIVATLWLFYTDAYSECIVACIQHLPYAVSLMVYLIGCFTTGVIFSQIVDFLASKHITVLDLVFYKNRLPWIKAMAGNAHVQLGKHIKIESYYNKYYKVQKAGLLGNVPQQEALSAFMLNLSALCIYYFLIALIFCICKCGCYNGECCLFMIMFSAIVIFIIAVISRACIEKKIYYSILRASRCC